MNTTAIKKPTSEPTPVNAGRDLANALIVAFQALTQLAEAGYKPQRISCEGPTPVIWIRYNGQCKHLHGVTKIISNLPVIGRQITMACRFAGAQVQWIEREI